jgi:hypothetical protein
MELDSKTFEFERATINVSCRVLQHRINQPAAEHITLNTCENTVTGELAAVLYSQIHEHLTVGSNRRGKQRVHRPGARAARRFLPTVVTQNHDCTACIVLQFQSTVVAFNLGCGFTRINSFSPLSSLDTSVK